MSIFNHINNDRLDSFVELIHSNKNAKYSPLVSEERRGGLKSGDAASKTIACIAHLVEWQNNLDGIKTEKDSKFLFNSKQFADVKESQQILNQLKRKFSRLFIENMAPSQLEVLAKETAETAGFYDPNNPSSASIPLTEYIFQYHGENTLCLELIARRANHRLSESSSPIGNSVSLFGEQGYRPDCRFIFTVASTSEQFPLSSNAWDFPGQKSSSLTSYTREKGVATCKRREDLKATNRSKLVKLDPWNRTVSTSAFKLSIQIAKSNDGSPLGNCAERSRRIFHRLTKERKFDCIVMESIKSGDHCFVVAKNGMGTQFDVMDGWNGAKLYAEKDTEKYLCDYEGRYHGDTGKPFLKPFNAKSSEIGVVAYNIYPLEAFKKDSKLKDPHLLRLLEEFHKIPNAERKVKMIKALEISRHIEDEMPLCEYIDPAIHELYDQMLYLTKKETKQGLTLPPKEEKDRCLVNEALRNLDLASLRKHLKHHSKMNAWTILHAIKASLLADNLKFLKEVVRAGVPIQENLFTAFYDPDPIQAIIKLSAALSAVNGSLDFTDECAKAAMNQINQG